MSTQDAHSYSGTGRRPSKDAALTDREYQLLLEGADRLDDYQGFQARFVILVAGRLGLRRAEIAHASAEWVDWRKNMLEIPRYQACTKGRDGGPCGDCVQKAEQVVDHNPGVSYAEAIGGRWQPKTETAARMVPFEFDPRAHLVVERFFERYDAFPISVQGVTRRVKAAAEAADELDPEGVFPHGLRATAATYHCGRGLSSLHLQSLMGWAQLSTARSYVAHSGEATARALHMVHSQ